MKADELVEKIQEYFSGRRFEDARDLVLKLAEENVTYSTWLLYRVAGPTGCPPQNDEQDNLLKRLKGMADSGSVEANFFLYQDFYVGRYGVVDHDLSIKYLKRCVDQGYGPAIKDWQAAHSQ